MDRKGTEIVKNAIRAIYVGMDLIFAVLRDTSVQTERVCSFVQRDITALRVKLNPYLVKSAPLTLTKGTGQRKPV